MNFDPPLVPGVLLRRYKRFLADVRLDDGREVVAHCTNTGRMTGCSDPGSVVRLAAARPGRKLDWTLMLVRAGRAWVSVDTLQPNRMVADALRRRRIPALADYDRVRTEVTLPLDVEATEARPAEGGAAAHGGPAVGGAPTSAAGPSARKGRSRIDVVLEDSSGRLPDCYVEVKNVTMRSGRTALFPDAVTERGLKHLHELARMARRGHRAVLLPFVARGDCDDFAAAEEVDPAWAEGLEQAAAAGVEVMPWRVRIDRSAIRLDRPLPWTRTARERNPLSRRL